MHAGTQFQRESRAGGGGGEEEKEREREKPEFGFQDPHSRSQLLLTDARLSQALGDRNAS